MQANLQHLWVPRDVDDPESAAYFAVHVVNCRQNMAVAGETYQDLDWPTLGQLVFPDSAEQDWA